MQLAAMADKLTDPEDREPGKGRKRRKREPTLQEKLYGQWDGTYGDHLERELGGGSAVKEPPLQDYEPPVFAPEVSDSDIEDSGGGPREAEPGKGGGGVGGAPPAPGAASCAPPGLDHDSGQPGADNGGSSGGLAEPGKGGGGGSGGAPPAPGAAGCAPPGPGLDHDSGQPGADNGGNSGGLADLARAAAAAEAEARRQPLVPAMVRRRGPALTTTAGSRPLSTAAAAAPGADNGGGSSGGLAEPGKGGGGSNSAPPAPDPGDGAPPGLDHDSGQAGADDGSNGGLAEPGKGGGGGGGAPPAPGAAGCVPPGLDHDSGQAGADDGSNGGLAERGKGGGGGGAPPAPGAAGCVPPGLDHDSGQAGADDGSNGGLAERGKGGGGGGGAPPAPGAAGCVPPGLDHDSGQAGADDGSNGGLAERGKGGGGGGAPPAPGAAGCAPPGLDHDSGQPGADNGGSSGGLAEPGTGGGGGGGAPPALVPAMAVAVAAAAAARRQPLLPVVPAVRAEGPEAPPMLFKPGSDKEEVLVVYNPREEIDIKLEPEPRETRIDRAEETAAVKFGIQVLDNLATWVEDEAKVTLRADPGGAGGPTVYGGGISGNMMHEYEGWQVAPFRNPLALPGGAPGDPPPPPADVDQTRVPRYNNAWLRAVAYQMLFTFQTFGLGCFTTAVFGINAWTSALLLGSVAVALLGPHEPRLALTASVDGQDRPILPLSVSLTAVFALNVVVNLVAYAVFFTPSIRAAWPPMLLPWLGDLIPADSWLLYAVPLLAPLCVAAGGAVEGYFAESRFNQWWHFAAFVILLLGLGLHGVLYWHLVHV
ncbi:hypothetical protein HXX76_014023 [Chlamydomonas incerta]|uniref:Uncharacterized protein n=1 Tax=Chlamydomonas incerta TaxID=51695 RepID=A0A835SJZ2_CHLIN|nr:hypothetical protein HXX76_014023 [Chlamydomonas incerta]|eukprot:KAG2424863.1 hypothetical protein HXX76_014023 [Chlamydomonas incerta]